MSENIEDRLTELEKAVLILRWKIEPETLVSEARERAKNLHLERLT